MAPRFLIRVRGLKTSFYTYQGVVKALDGVDIDVHQGETVGLVGETGSGKSVTALSFLRLIPQPPGKIEAGEALVDVSEEEVAKIASLRAEIRVGIEQVLGIRVGWAESALTMAALDGVSARLAASRAGDPNRRKELAEKIAALKAVIAPRDLLSLPEEELQEIRGNLISMIFQEPMQALNPVYPVGDQIAESIVLHRRRWLSRRIVLRMRAETLRRRVVADLKETFRGREASLMGVDLGSPSRADLRLILTVLGRERSANARLVDSVRELLAFMTLLGMDVFGASVYSRYLPKGLQLRQYEGESLTVPWRAADVLDELAGLSVVVRGTKDGRAPWVAAEATGLYDVALTPPAGVTPADAAAKVRELLGATQGPAEAWNLLGKVVGPPKAEGGRVVLSVLPARRQPPRRLGMRRTSSSEGIVYRIPLVRRWMRHARQRQSMDEAAEVLRLLNIPDPARVATMYPHELSGGMNQRAMIAIALACDPMLLIADEPTTALDVTIQAQILDLLRLLKSKGRPSILLITHDLGVIAEMCDRVNVMYGGHVVERATVRDIFKAPLHPYTTGLLKAIPSHAVKKDRLEVIKGSVPNLIYPPSGCRFHPRCPAAMPHCGWDAKDLEPVVREAVEGLGANPKFVTTVAGDNPFVLRLSFAGHSVGTIPSVAEWLGRERPTSVLLQAVTGIRREGDDLIFTMIASRKPLDQEVRPGHMVACYLYEERVDARALENTVSEETEAPSEPPKPAEVA